MAEEITKTDCPYCKGDMIRSATVQKGQTFMFWEKPWSSWGSKTVRLWAYACMSCGKVIFELEDGDQVMKDYADQFSVDISEEDEGETVFELD